MLGVAAGVVLLDVLLGVLLDANWLVMAVVLVTGF
jgi:hypothetical protein